MPSLVRDEFGPTLPDLIASRTGRPTRRVRILLLALIAAVIVVGLGARAIQREAAAGDVVVLDDARVPVNLTYDDSRLERVAPEGDELLRLETPADAKTPMAFTVAERRLPAYEGDAAGFVPLYAERLIAEQRAADPDFVLRGEGKARINDSPGYQIVFQTKVDGETAYGKRFLLYDDPDDTEETINRPRIIADVTLLNGRSKAIPNADAVGGNGPLKTPLRSFRFGTERP